MSETAIVIDWQKRYSLEVERRERTEEELNFAQDCFELACQRIIENYHGSMLDYIHEEIRKEMMIKYKKEEEKNEDQGESEGANPDGCFCQQGV